MWCSSHLDKNEITFVWDGYKFHIALVLDSIENYVVDTFTKALGIGKLIKFKSMINVLDVHLTLKGTVENRNTINWLSSISWESNLMSLVIVLVLTFVSWLNFWCWCFGTFFSLFQVYIFECGKNLGVF